MTCNGDCFNCKYSDCVATYQEISKLDYQERKKRREEKEKYLENMKVEMIECKNKRKAEINSERAKGA